MNNVEEPSKCQHKDCSCPAPETGKTYCSDFCEEAATAGLGEGCQCGHAGCNS